MKLKQQADLLDLETSLMINDRLSMFYGVYVEPMYTHQQTLTF